MENDKINEAKLAELEALLFLHGEPLPLNKIIGVLKLSAEDSEILIKELKTRLEDQSRGLTLVSNMGKIQLVTKPQFGKILEDFVKEELEEELTPASLESLAIITYFGPISRNRIEYLRGVNSIFILRSLLLRGLVERFPDPERQNAYLYQPTFDLLKHLGLKDKEELPDFEKFKSLLVSFEAAESENNLQSATEAFPVADPPVSSQEAN